MKRVILLILDGWGIGKKDAGDAIFKAHTPFIDSLYEKVPYSTLLTFGQHVGLPEGQMGNSEVGHMNIGAGRVVWQMLERINNAFAKEEVETYPAFQKLLKLAAERPGAKIHLMGLLSDGGVHSSMDHLLSLTRILKKNKLDTRTFVHAFTDGRDTDPYSGRNYIAKTEASDDFGKAQIASICGRYYAMDRDHRWERTKKAYDLLVNGIGESFLTADEAMKQLYERGISDEFISPLSIQCREGRISIAENDIVLCFNFRTDRARQITRVLTQEDMHEFNMHRMMLHYFTLTSYDKRYSGVEVLFEDKDLRMTLGEILSLRGLKQLRAAETEKYPHVTFFFNGGREEPFSGEYRLMVSSPKVATYDLQPEMSAPELTARLEKEIESIHYDFICVNFANPDMVGHTGVFPAIVKACETVDACAERLVKLAEVRDYAVIIIADHGNADKAINEDGSPNTAHSTNPVPCFLLNTKYKSIADGKLADIAPTILQIMDIPLPEEMGGKSLV